MSATLEVRFPHACARFSVHMRGEDKVRWIDPRHDEHWNSRLHKTFPTASIFHTSNWASVLSDTYNFRPLYVSNCRSEDLIPLMEIDSWATGKRGVSLPFSDSCPPLAKDASAFGASWTSVLQLAAERKWRRVSLRGGGDYLPAETPSVSYLEHSVALHADRDRQLRNLHPPTRRAVRKALASPLTITFSRDRADLRTFFRLFCATRKRHGVPPPPFRFFDNIYRHILSPELGTLVLAHLHGAVVAAAIFFHFADTAHFKFAASDFHHQSHRPNNLIIWEAMRYFQERGARQLHFGRTSTSNSGLRNFKLGWGASESVLRYFTYDLQDRAFRPSRDQANRWHSALFRALPSPLFRLIGSMTYRHIA